jgi:tricorn protease-like protein
MGTRDGRVLAISVGRGKLAIYDLQAFKKVNELDFASRLAMFRFSSDSSRLLVITRDQKAYYFDTKQLLAGPQVAVSK